MHAGLTTKVLAVLAAAASLIVVPWVGMTLTAHVTALEDEYVERARSTARMLDAAITSEARLADRERLFSDLQRVLWLDPDILGIAVRVARGGELPMLLSTSGHDGTAHEHLAREAFESRSVRHHIADTPAGRVVRVATPIQVSRDVVGALCVELTLERVDAVIARQVRQWLQFGALSLAALALVLFFAMDRMVLRPVRALTGAVAAFGRGEPRRPLALRTGDELGQLGETFETMRESLTAANARVEHLAYHDSLTGLANRRRFLDVLESETRTAWDGSPSRGLVCIDLAGFKLINDSLGHAVGDALLVQLAERFVRLSADGEHVARIGGDEFAFVVSLDAPPPVSAREVLEARARSILDECVRTVHLDSHAVHVSASVGARLLEDDCADAEEALRDADAAMTEARRGGLNRVMLHPERQSRAALVRATIRRNIHAALRDGAIDLHLQPQVGPDGVVRSAEALLRWTVPGIGVLPAEDVVAIADEFGLTRELGLRVTHEACRIHAEIAMHRGPRSGLESIGLNVSASEFLDVDFAERLVGLRDAFELAPGSVELELTERALVTDMDRVAGVMRELRSEGFRIAVDDFGTGYSSFAYLKRLPIDTLKVDGSFVRDMFAGPRERALVALIVKAAREFDLEVVAEGVQTEDHFQALRDLGCDRFQGFLFGAAMPVAEFERTLDVPRDAVRQAGAGDD